MLNRLQQAGAAASVLEALRKEGLARMTLDQARQEVAAIEQQVREVQNSVNAARDSALSKLEGEVWAAAGKDRAGQSERHV